MKKSLLMIPASFLFAGAVLAQTAAPATTAVPSSNQKPASSNFHAICKDGTAFDSSSKRGACSGHGGIDKKATAGLSGDAPMKSAPVAAQSSKPASAAADQVAADGKVWVNTSTNIYHCMGDKYYGKTKHGEYRTESDAKTKGFHASHGKGCAK